ncbi:MAG: RNA methyltransferase [Gemmatimonadales bacterium]|jgi:TrmH family RNA methyltransferase|nr:RNA methyltransferase [Gemmatimonadales bacterium]
MATSLVTQVRNLQRRKARKRTSLAVAEGVRLVEEALAAGVPVAGVIVARSAAAHERTADLVAQATARAIPVEEVEDRLFAELADTETPQGILAIVDPPSWRLDDVHVQARQPALVLDGVQDPGNVGTLLRTAFALGVPGALLLPGTADPRNPKVLRGAMGATFRLPTVLTTDDEFASWTRKQQITVWAAVSEGKALARTAVPERLALVVGNEGAGVRQFIRELSRQRVAIPLTRGVESLNVAVAAGILLYEVCRAE